MQDCIIKQTSYSRTNTPRGSIVSLSRGGALSPTNSFMCRSVTHVDTVVSRHGLLSDYDGGDGDEGDGDADGSRYPTGVLGMTDSRSQRSQRSQQDEQPRSAGTAADDRDRVVNLYEGV